MFVCLGHTPAVFCVHELMQVMSRKKGGVSFLSSEKEDNDSITVTKSSANTVTVHVGFLKVNHR